MKAIAKKKQKSLLPLFRVFVEASRRKAPGTNGRTRRGESIRAFGGMGNGKGGGSGWAVDQRECHE